MRVIAGRYKSRQLKTVKSQQTRPTTDKNKENLFNIIGPYFDGGICLDLFAGSGGLGIEALSRGMDYLYSVDKQYQAYKVILENYKNLKIDNAKAIKSDYRKALENLNDKQFDLLILDPPYKMHINNDIIAYCLDHDMFHNDCIIVIEDENEDDIQEYHNCSIIRQVTYGITRFTILKYKEDNL